MFVFTEPMARVAAGLAAAGGSLRIEFREDSAVVELASARRPAAKPAAKPAERPAARTGRGRRRLYSALNEATGARESHTLEEWRAIVADGSTGSAIRQRLAKTGAAWTAKRRSAAERADARGRRLQAAIPAAGADPGGPRRGK